MKESRIGDDEDGGLSASEIREIAILKNLNHPNVVKLIEYIKSNNSKAMVFELCTSDLKQLARK